MNELADGRSKGDTELPTKLSAELDAIRHENEVNSLNRVDSGEVDPLAKLEFKGLDPRFSDVVYHFTTTDGLMKIRQEGLRYADKVHEIGKDVNEAFAAADRLLMDVKPPDIPVDLEHTVFGQLEQRHLGASRDPALKSGIRQGESIAIAVDPNDTYVGDARIREELVAAPEWGTQWMGGDVAAVRELFWESVMPLSKFKELYEPVQTEADDDGHDIVSWQLKDPANQEKLGIDNWVEYPELYIPLEAGEDTIPVERLDHTASSLLGRTDTRL